MNELVALGQGNSKCLDDVVLPVWSNMWIAIQGETVEGENLKEGTYAMIEEIGHALSKPQAGPSQMNTRAGDKKGANSGRFYSAN
jgi:hypothetical protein